MEGFEYLISCEICERKKMTVFWWPYVIQIIPLKNSSKYISKSVKGLVFLTASLLILDKIYELVERYLYMLFLFWITIFSI